MNGDKLYAFVMRGELTKTALEKTDVVCKHSASEILSKEYVKSLSLELLDEEYVNAAKEMATVYTAIAAFENSVRRFVVKVLLENKGENWWVDCVSEKIRNKADELCAKEFYPLCVAAVAFIFHILALDLAGILLFALVGALWLVLFAV